MANIVFKPSDDVVDAFTGGSLKGQIFKCQECNSKYGKDSVDHIVSENDGCCISCGKKDILISCDSS